VRAYNDIALRLTNLAGIESADRMESVPQRGSVGSTIRITSLTGMELVATTVRARQADPTLPRYGTDLIAFARQIHPCLRAAVADLRLMRGRYLRIR